MASTPSPDASKAAQRPGLLSVLQDRNIDRRVFGLAAALIIEALIIALLFSLGAGIIGEPEAEETLTTFSAIDPTTEPEPAVEEAPPPAEAPPAPETPQQPAPEVPPEPVPEQPAPPVAQPPAVVLPVPAPAPPAQPPAPPPAAPARPARSYGPPSTGSSSSVDSQRVGNAPNGEPLYAARWYREPTDGELAGYLSTATGPGAAMIVCRTVPDFYVEDCELLGETPPGSQIGRAVLAAAWQFRVRPATVGGRSQVGSWVRIRIDYVARP